MEDIELLEKSIEHLKDALKIEYGENVLVNRECLKTALAELDKKPRTKYTKTKGKLEKFIEENYVPKADIEKLMKQKINSRDRHDKDEEPSEWGMMNTWEMYDSFADDLKRLLNKG